jgi:peroxiredoxin
MKKLVSIVLLSAVIFSCKTEPQLPPLPANEYEITVLAEGVFNGLRAYVGTKNNRRQNVYIDTAMVVNELAVFTGKVNSSKIQNLTINGVKGELSFVLEPGRTTIKVYKDSLDQSIVDGGQNNKDHREYQTQVAKFTKSMATDRTLMNTARSTNDTETYNKLNNQYQVTSKALNNYWNTFIEEHPKSEYSLLLLESVISNSNLNLEQVKSSRSALSSVITKNAGTQSIGSKVDAFILQREALSKLDIGKVPPSFSAPDPDGNMIALNDIKGKVTIIDFWASWCRPCRLENPNVVKVYEKYHDKGLEIIGVSLDRPNQKNRWLDAIEQDNLTWHHVSNLQYYSEPVARLYNVRSIPSTFILDAEGKIAAKNLRGPALEQQIASMLD